MPRSDDIGINMPRPDNNAHVNNINSIPVYLDLMKMSIKDQHLLTMPMSMACLVVIII